MGHVAVATGTTALFLASADREDVKPLERLLKRARDARMTTERRNDATDEIRDAWTTWYEEAIASAGRLMSTDR
jgi:hypothetical protein